MSGDKKTLIAMKSFWVLENKYFKAIIEFFVWNKPLMKKCFNFDLNFKSKLKHKTRNLDSMLIFKMILKILTLEWEKNWTTLEIISIVCSRAYPRVYGRKSPDQYDNQVKSYFKKKRPT